MRIPELCQGTKGVCFAQIPAQLSIGNVNLGEIWHTAQFPTIMERTGWFLRTLRPLVHSYGIQI